MTVKDFSPSFRSFNDWFALRGVAEHATHLIPYIKRDSRIIDVGCGIGSITLDLARRAPDGYVLGVDYSEESVANAKAEAKAQGLTNVDFIQGDATNLSHIEAESFDISHSHQVILHLAEPIKALKEIRRVLKPGGIVAIRDNFDRHTIPDFPAIDRNWEVIYRDLSRKRGANPEAGKVHHIWMHEAGFEWENIQFGSVAWNSRVTQRKSLQMFRFRTGLSMDYPFRLRRRNL